VDYAAPTGTPVKASGDGRIAYACVKSGYGKCIRIDHGNAYSSYYGHLSAFAPTALRKGRVGQGDIIGYVGATGVTTGPHLDYRISLYGKFINPLSLKADPMKRVPADKMADFLALKSRRDSVLSGPSNTLYASSGSSHKPD
jgi:murein DD-endopeptidase MepM/ murein hydrolase activator NlpD